MNFPRLRFLLHSPQREECRLRNKAGALMFGRTLSHGTSSGRRRRRSPGLLLRPGESDRVASLRWYDSSSSLASVSAGMTRAPARSREQLCLLNGIR